MAIVITKGAVSPDTFFGGIYDVPEAALYLRATSPLPTEYALSSTKLIRWMRTGLATPDVSDIHGRDLVLDFQSLISLRITAALRSFGVSLQEIRRSEIWLRENSGENHPFATEFLWTGQGQLYVEWEKQLVSASRRGQAALGLLREFVRPVNDLVFDGETHRAASWEPVPSVTLVPQVQFGAPCIKGTRIPTRSVAGMIDAGDSPGRVAEAYGISAEEVQAARDWEQRLFAA